jgi:AcrR family transcriptional regulator
MTEQTLSRGEVTRRNILDAAFQLFIDQGYHGTSMRQIARQAHVALGGLYNHFPGKEEVFQAVFLEYHPYHDVVPALLKAHGETIEDALQDTLARMNAAIKARPHFINLLFIEIVEFDSVHTGKLFASIFPELLEVARRVYERFQDRLRPIPLPFFVRSFLGLFFSYYITELLFASHATDYFRQGALDRLLDIYLHGILADGTS